MKINKIIKHKGIKIKKPPLKLKTGKHKKLKIIRGPIKLKRKFKFIEKKLKEDNDKIKEKTKSKKDRIRVLVIYDITDNKKRREIVKFLSGYGVRVQKSAFEMFLDKKKIKELKKGLKNFRGNGDKINIYQFSKFSKIYKYGKPDIKDYADDIII